MLSVVAFSAAIGGLFAWAPERLGPALCGDLHR